MCPQGPTCSPFLEGTLKPFRVSLHPEESFAPHWDEFTARGKSQPQEPLIPRDASWLACLLGTLMDLLPQTFIDLAVSSHASSPEWCFLIGHPFFIEKHLRCPRKVLWGKSEKGGTRPDILSKDEENSPKSGLSFQRSFLWDPILSIEKCFVAKSPGHDRSLTEALGKSCCLYSPSPFASM